MPYEYSNPADASDPHKLPDVEVFQLTAEEVAENDPEALREFISENPQFRLAFISAGTFREAVKAFIEENNIEGGWFYQFDGELNGPYPTREAALTAAREE